MSGKRSYVNILPAGSQSNSDGSSDRAQFARGKRQQVSIACNACRSRKSKCSGERPICSSCSSRNLECVYDFEAETTRFNATKQRNVELEEEVLNSNRFVDRLRRAPDHDALVILSRLRAGEEVGSIMRTEASPATKLQSVSSPSMSWSQHHPQTYPYSAQGSQMDNLQFQLADDQLSDNLPTLLTESDIPSLPVEMSSDSHSQLFMEEQSLQEYGMIVEGAESTTIHDAGTTQNPSSWASDRTHSSPSSSRRR